MHDSVVGSWFVRAALAAALTGCCLGCGEEDEPHPGYAEPCETPMRGVLGCPPAGTQTPKPTGPEACARLVACGILAGEYYGSQGQECSASAECQGGKCLPTSSGQRCHYPYLDYEWCVSKLTDPRSDPCGSDQDFTALQVDSAVRCILSTPCGSLGLSFADKQQSSDKRGDLDKYTCKSDSKTTIWTATICDHGMLRY